jgi:hypothetical protein
MSQKRVISTSVLSIALVMLVLLMPVLVNQGTFEPLCRVNAAMAQDNPCLVQEVTNSAQQLQILQLQGTDTAKEIQIVRLQSTNAALQERVNRPSVVVVTVPVVITVSVLITPTPSPSINPLPTGLFDAATQGTVHILDITDIGDITAEAVEIENTGDTVNFTGWTLRDSDGNIFTFPEQFLFSHARVTLYTRAGRNTAIAFYWGLDEAQFEPGELVTLANSEGVVQFSFTIPSS